MAGPFIELVNKTLPNLINREGNVHTALVGREDFTPESVISESSDFNCGALCNEFEFARKVTQYYASALWIENAEGEELDELVMNLVDLSRRSRSEPDSLYQNRFKFLVVAKTNPRRTTKWAIIDSISHFINDSNRINIFEFGSSWPQFEVRIESEELEEDVLVLDDPTFGYLDSFYVSGFGIGANVSYISELIDRIKAAGVDSSVTFISKNKVDLTSNMWIGSVQIYLSSDAIISANVGYISSLDDPTFGYLDSFYFDES